MGLLEGKNVLINFFYANCKDGVCPVTTENLVKFQKLLGDRCGKDVFMYSFSLAPEQDTPARLREYAVDEAAALAARAKANGKPAIK